jgi:uncharacterized protein YdeI (YjbR/CyaY-like superfamily)
MNPKADFYFRKSKKWQEELEELREIILNCGLNEQVKWGVPCYSYNDTNVVLIHEFKEYCAMLFFKGVLLKDPKKILVQQTKNVQSARQIRFTGIKEIQKMEKTLKAYVYEAIEIEKAGLTVELKKTKEYPVPDELKAVFKGDPEFKKAFYALTPGRQRGYLLYFSSAKQAKTREARIEKYTKNILKGKGLED